MRVLHYLRDVAPEKGGVAVAVVDLCRQQARAGAEVVLATCDPPPAGFSGAGGEPRCVRLNPPGRLQGLEAAFHRQFAPLLDWCDVVHLHAIWDLSQVPLARMARRAGKPYIQSPHGMLADWCLGQKRLKKQVYLAVFGQRLIDGAAAMCLTAEEELRQSRKTHPRTPGRVLPLIVNLEPYRELPSPEPARRKFGLGGGGDAGAGGEPVLLYLSRVHYKKRPDSLIAAAALARKRGVPVRVEIAGPCDAGYLATLKEFAGRLGVGDSTRFLGMIAHADRASLYAAADLFVLPTQQENFGFVSFEALACGTPVITTRGADTWRDLEGGGGARIVDCVTPDVRPWGASEAGAEQLADAIIDMVGDRARLRAMGAAGRRWVFDALEPTKIIGGYLDLYEDVKAGRPIGEAKG